MRIFLFFLLLPHFCCSTYYSQIGQDKFVNENYFFNKKGGIFVDIGAHDGITFSNTYFFESELDWNGLCIEPIPEVFDQLKVNRCCNCIRGCITDFEGDGEFLRITSPFVNTEMLSGLVNKYDPRHLGRVKQEIETHGGSYEIINVKCYLINNLLEEYRLNHIDFLSIDTEGGEFDIISNIDFSKYIIDVIAVEDNYNDPRFVEFLESKGYLFVGRNGWDLLFVRKAFFDEVSATFTSNSSDNEKS